MGGRSVPAQKPLTAKSFTALQLTGSWPILENGWPIHSKELTVYRRTFAAQTPDPGRGPSQFSAGRASERFPVATPGTLHQLILMACLWLLACGAGLAGAGGGQGGESGARGAWPVGVRTPGPTWSSSIRSTG